MISNRAGNGWHTLGEVLMWLGVAILGAFILFGLAVGLMRPLVGVD